jgi:hypothetical protein
MVWGPTRGRSNRAIVVYKVRLALSQVVTQGTAYLDTLSWVGPGKNLQGTATCSDR